MFARAYDVGSEENFWSTLTRMELRTEGGWWILMTLNQTHDLTKTCTIAMTRNSMNLSRSTEHASDCTKRRGDQCALYAPNSQRHRNLSQTSEALQADLSGSDQVQVNPDVNRKPE